MFFTGFVEELIEFIPVHPVLEGLRGFAFEREDIPISPRFGGVEIPHEIFPAGFFRAAETEAVVVLALEMHCFVAEFDFKVRRRPIVFEFDPLEGIGVGGKGFFQSLDIRLPSVKGEESDQCDEDASHDWKNSTWVAADAPEENSTMPGRRELTCQKLECRGPAIQDWH